MTIGIYTRTETKRKDPRLLALEAELKAAGCNVYRIGRTIIEHTDLLLAVGGDGTFLLAAAMVGASGIPVAGVNTGRLGFLSENRPEDIAAALVSGNYSVESRTMIQAVVDGVEVVQPFALNEISVRRIGQSMLGVDVRVDSETLPTYWADGLIVATASGSTAYSLSVGGPIVTPSSRVLIISPIAPHNLNVRPLIVPETSTIELSFRSREDRMTLAYDNRSVEIPSDASVTISVAQFSLNRVRLEKNSFFTALTSKLFWGEDIRNI